MGYTLAKYLSINLKTLTAKISGASNNVYPRTFESYSVVHDPEKNALSKTGLFTEKEAFLFKLMQWVDDGSLQLTKSVNVKYLYAFGKLSQELKRTGISLYQQNTDILNHNFEKVDEIKSLIHFFENKLLSDDIKGEFVIKVEKGYILKLYKWRYRYAIYIGDAAVFNSYKEAWVMSRRVTDGQVIAKDFVNKGNH